MTTRLLQTIYVDSEGRPSMEACIRASFEFCRDHGIGKVVLFTSTGDGAMFAVDNFLTREDFSLIQMVAVTPPAGKPYRLTPDDNKSALVSSGVQPARKDFLRDMGVPVISAHMPFKVTTGASPPVWNESAEAFGVLGGGFSLCVQAVLMACDAGEVEMGERVVAASADTSIVAIASRTELFLAPHHGLLVEHIVCRPRRFNISKRHHVALEGMGQLGTAGALMSVDTGVESRDFIDVEPTEAAQQLVLGTAEEDDE
jgi:hypothetical protein